MAVKKKKRGYSERLGRLLKGYPTKDPKTGKVTTRAKFPFKKAKKAAVKAGKTKMQTDREKQEAAMGIHRGATPATRKRKK